MATVDTWDCEHFAKSHVLASADDICMIFVAPSGAGTCLFPTWSSAILYAVSGYVCQDRGPRRRGDRENFDATSSLFEYVFSE